MTLLHVTNQHVLTVFAMREHFQINHMMSYRAGNKMANCGNLEFSTQWTEVY